ncbi:Major facilitator superfamily domaingeneral substrate transporter [Penicillium sp. IBT 31633x]|nr:Major facilitator superfamily domaingeneral substrate transporter [Penicillium sp. IBT 31633x]
MTSHPQEQAYSVFTKSEKDIAVFLVTFAATFLSFVLIHLFSSYKCPLCLTQSVGREDKSHLAGLAPAIVGDMAYMTGRRNVYLLTMFIYTVANIGLAVQSSWIALFLLRMVQSAGGAAMKVANEAQATIAMGYGVISDIAPPSERGGYVGVLLMGPNFATVIGPILAGALTEAPGWRWIFWISAIASGICVLSIALFLPETCRSIVGNGSKSTSALHSPLFQKFRQYYSSGKLISPPAGNEEELALPKFRIPNPLMTLKILAARDSLLITVIYGIYYLTFSSLQGSLSTLFIDIYGLSNLKARIVYLPFSISSYLSAYCSGNVSFFFNRT